MPRRRFLRAERGSVWLYDHRLPSHAGLQLPDGGRDAGL